LLNSALALYEGPEIEDETDTNPIPELYHPLNPDHMQEVIGNISFYLDSFVYSDIVKNPPSPYNDTKLNITQEFDKIDVSKERPYYEFYRAIKKTFSNFRDANYDILGDKLPHFLDDIYFPNYSMCLPFKFYLDYEENQEVYMYIKEYPKCSKHYNDSSLTEKIKVLAKEPVLKINGQDAFDFLQEFGREFYKFKNPDSHFSIIIDSIHDNKLVYTPISLEQLNHINVSFKNGETLNTKFHIIKTPEETQKKLRKKMKLI
jgi:hypothetical protein